MTWGSVKVCDRKGEGMKVGVSKFKGDVMCMLMQIIVWRCVVCLKFFLRRFFPEEVFTFRRRFVLSPEEKADTFDVNVIEEMFWIIIILDSLAFGMKK